MKPETLARANAINDEMGILRRILAQPIEIDSCYVNHLPANTLGSIAAAIRAELTAKLIGLKAELDTL